METLAIAISALGHAFWDNVMSWMVAQDPDASILHLHWMRMLFMTCCLFILSYRDRQVVQRPWYWWFKFSLVGFTIPSIMYTLSVMWEGYRISVSLQTFIPLVVLWRTHSILDEWRCGCIILALFGTITIWWAEPLRHDLWIVWASLAASVVQIFATSEFFVMICEIKKHKLRAIASAAGISVVTMFLLMAFIVHPKHLFVTAAKNAKIWLLVLVCCAVTGFIKYWLIARFSESMSPDGIAIFECVHPIATLISDIMWERDTMEWHDGLAVLFFVLGWILYPKRIYREL